MVPSLSLKKNYSDEVLLEIRLGNGLNILARFGVHCASFCLIKIIVQENSEFSSRVKLKQNPSEI